jgi:hypothetical protein
MVLTGTSITVYIAFNTNHPLSEAPDVPLARKQQGEFLMRRSRLAARAVATAGSLLALGGVAAAAATSGRTVVHFPANGPGGQDSHTCFWGVAYTQETHNYVYPDSHTGYGLSVDTIPAGGKIVLHGQFPHARFFSLTTSSPLGVIHDYLYDDQIKPDPGSTNPYLPGANRNAMHRSYTVTVVNGPAPTTGSRPANTVYAGAPGAPVGQPFLLVDRQYLPDKGRNFWGGVPAPSASYVAANGATATGQAACAALATKSGAFSVADLDKLIFPETKIEQELAKSSSPEAPAVKQAVWYKYFGPLWLMAPYFAGTPDAGLISSLPLHTTGLGANPANGYVFTWLDRRFGPNHHGHNIAVLRGKLPTTPATYVGEARMQGGTQLRYWSLCNGENPYSGKTTGPCLADEEVPISRQREYTIVVSLPQDRPSNATDRCGVAWMNYGTTGDGFTRPDSTMLLLRNLATTAHPAFKHAVQNIADPSQVRQVMGAYLPTVSYTTAAKFQKTGCGAR